MEIIRERRAGLIRSALGGAAGGLLGSAAMAILQFVFRRHLRRLSNEGPMADTGIGFQTVFRREEPARIVARKIGPAALGSQDSSFVGALLLHEAFGAGAGLFYALVVRRSGLVRRTEGAPFALLLWLGAAELGLPALSLTLPPSASSPVVQSFGLFAHLVYGMTLEATCRVVCGSSAN